MRAELVEILAEPITGAKLALTITKERDGRVEEGELVAEGSGKKFPITGGIPRFVPDQGYVSNFGRQWNKFREVQLDSDNQLGESRRRFDTETDFTPDLIRGQYVLDAGCGAGRFAEIAASYGAKVVGVDLSSAVEATAETLRRHPNADVVQADMFALPFKKGTFPFVYSIGVIQHTPDPAGAIRSILPFVREGGKFALTIYGRHPWTKLNAKYIARTVTRRLPEPVLLKAIETSMPVLFPLTDKLFRLPAGIGKIARFAIPVANYVERTDQTREQRYAEAVLDTFDMLAPRYDQPMSAREVEDAIHAAGGAVTDWKSRVPVVVTGTR